MLAIDLIETYDFEMRKVPVSEKEKIKNNTKMINLDDLTKDKHKRT